MSTPCINRRAAAAALAITAGLPIAPARAAGPRTLRCYPTGPIYSYRWDALRLALSHSGADWRGVRIEPTKGEALTQPRAERLVQAGELDVVCFGVNAARMKSLRPIRFDVMKGMVGLRYMLVRRGDQQRLARLTDKEYLRTVRFGLQEQWADVVIMQANGLQLELASRAERLVEMLSAGRCDALPRGANEVLLELQAHRNNKPPLAVESSRVFYFPFPIYFWVRDGNEALAQAIESGLRHIDQSGELQQLFMRTHRRELEFVRNSKQRVIQLATAALPQPLEKPDTSWWWPFA